MHKSVKNYQLNLFAHWLLSHLRAFLFALGELINAPVTSLMTLLVIGIAMALPSGLYIMLQNFKAISQDWHKTPSISLYLKENVSESETKHVLDLLRQNPAVTNIKYVSPEQGMSDFEKLTQLNGLLLKLDKNPLPAVIVVTPRVNQESGAALQALFNGLKKLPEVEASQLDVLWIERLYYLVTLSERIIFSMAILFGAGVILIIGNTIRLTTQNKRQEIQVLWLIGATHGFIARPLLYRGLLYGVTGGALAWFLVCFMLHWLEIPAQALAKTYDYTLVLQGLNYETGAAIIGLCALWGWIGSWVAVRRHLYS